MIDVATILERLKLEPTEAVLLLPATTTPRLARGVRDECAPNLAVATHPNVEPGEFAVIRKGDAAYPDPTYH